MPGRLGTGITITMATSNFVFEILAINAVDVERPEVEDIHFGSTAEATLLGKIKRVGALEGDAVLEPDTGLIGVGGAPPINADPEQVTLQFPAGPGQASGAKLEGQAGLTRWNWTAPLEDRMTAQWRIKWTEEPTFTAGAAS